MPPRLTELRLHLLRTVLRLTRESGGPPSAAELARHLRVSEAAVSAHLRALRDLGFVERSGPRGRLHLSEKALAAVGTGLPIYGQIAAGPPILAEQQPDRTTPSLDVLLGVRDGDYLLVVRGDSMTGIGVMDGDYVLVRPAQDVHDGEVAVVLVPGENSATLKRLYRSGGQVTLLSENPAHPRMRFAAADVQVQGRMVARVGLPGTRPGAPRE
ncbi:transcriptional repressor LexA [Deinococcus aquiradiocola]|uniref:LexA repressor n=1 Tax=Deinococcus aquiradiocola TaxID=393059 RepID=A0A917PC65_9DEIO|nr:transcriptional repressor LexA [Deinococcus aquiradiocola]GGJ70614.1 lexA repressor [Deinococcus aquiradiocola]